MLRYLILGCSGSGKSTLAREISRRCGIPYINTDALFWTRDWELLSVQEVIKAMDLDAKGYVLEGNFASNRDQVWSKVDVIVWLDYKRLLVMRRLVLRNLRWWLFGESAWNGTRMPYRRALAGIRHGAESYAKKRATFPGYLSEFPEKEIHRITTPKEVVELLNQLCSS